MNPGLTIIIPVYNRAHLVCRTLDSVEAQTYRPLRLIIVDNDSSDDTYQVIEEWAKKHANKLLAVDVIQEKQPGAAAARNAALQLVKTEWTMFFDSDDTMDSDHVDMAMTAAKLNPQAKIIGWPVRMHRLNGDVTIEKFESRDLAFNCVQHGALATVRYMARTELFIKAGSWRNDVRVWDDIELGIRLLRHITSPRQVVSRQAPITVDVYAQHNSITGINHYHNYQHSEHALDCIEANLPHEDKWIVDLKRAILAGLYAKEGNPDHSRRLMLRIKERNARRKAIYAWACNYTSLHGRGAANMLRPLFYKQPQTLWKYFKLK